jgi:hypothetical protein
MRIMRQDWFENWKKGRNGDAQSLLQFHREAGIGNPEIDVLMKRPKVGTVSITQVIKQNETIQMNYEAI